MTQYWYNAEELCLNLFYFFKRSSCLVTIKDAVKKFLLEDTAKNDKIISKNDKYLSIKRALESKALDVKIEFIISTIPLFDEFMAQVPNGRTNDSHVVPK